MYALTSKLFGQNFQRVFHILIARRILALKFYHSKNAIKLRIHVCTCTRKEKVNNTYRKENSLEGTDEEKQCLEPQKH
jgi:hypothetical protein